MYVLFFLSGAVGLIYEVMWMRSFSVIFGSTTRAAAVVLAAFFAGMAVGNVVGGRWSRKAERALCGYGVAELVVAVGALGVGLWTSLFRAWYPTLVQSIGAESAVLTGLRLLLAVVALALPCVAMGATLPLMSQALVVELGGAGRRVAGLYALNTVGATLGVLAAGFLLPVWIGTSRTIQLGAVLNVLIGLGALVLARSRRSPLVEVPPAAGRAPGHVLLVAALSGFGTLALEVLYTRLLVNESDCSVYSFAVMLATFLTFLALGALVASAWVDRLKRPWGMLGWTQVFAAIAIIASPRLFVWINAWLGSGKPASAFEAAGLVVAKAALLMGPAVLLAGVTLPTVWRIATRAAGELGECVGGLTAVNTVAAVAGSVAAGFVIIPWLGIGRGFVLVGIVYAILAVMAWSRVYEDHRRVNAAVGVGLLVAGLCLLRVWVVVPSQRNAEDRLIHYHEGEGATVAVLETPARERYLTVNTHYSLGGTSPGALALQKSQGRLALALHPRPARVVFIGIATGISVSAVLEFPVERVVAVELIPGIVDAARHFATANGGVLSDPRVETVVTDGRNYIYATNEHFDVIVGDLFIPWEAGTGYLYTAEHFENVRRKLAEGGLFVQWLPGYQLALDEVRIIAATFCDVFPDAALWLYQDATTPAVALVGGVGGGAGLERVSVAPQRAGIGRSNLRFVCGGARLREWTAGAPRNTDEFPRIEFATAGSHFLRGADDTRALVDAVLAQRGP